MAQHAHGKYDTEGTHGDLSAHAGDPETGHHGDHPTVGTYIAVFVALMILPRTVALGRSAVRASRTVTGEPSKSDVTSTASARASTAATSGRLSRTSGIVQTSVPRRRSSGMTSSNSR